MGKARRQRRGLRLVDGLPPAEYSGTLAGRVVDASVALRADPGRAARAVRARLPRLRAGASVAFRPAGDLAGQDAGVPGQRSAPRLAARPGVPPRVRLSPGRVGGAARRPGHAGGRSGTAGFRPEPARGLVASVILVGT